MGWFKDTFWDDKPCLWIHIETDDKPKRAQRAPPIGLENNYIIHQLLDENKQLKKQLVMRRINAIDVEDVKLLR